MAEPGEFQVPDQERDHRGYGSSPSSPPPSFPPPSFQQQSSPPSSPPPMQQPYSPQPLKGPLPGQQNYTGYPHQQYESYATPPHQQQQQQQYSQQLGYPGQPTYVPGPVYTPQTGYSPRPVNQGTSYPVPQRPVNEWNNRLFGCLDDGELCVKTTFCPCVTFGKTSARLKDPLLTAYDTVNHDCFVWSVLGLCGISFLYQMMKRKEVRQTFLIKGDDVEDCVISGCCACCALIQQEKETVQRQRGFPKEADAVAQRGYEPHRGGMAMPQPAERPEMNRNPSSGHFSPRAE